MMLDHLGETGAAAAVMAAIEWSLVYGPKTRDLGGSATTDTVGKAVAEFLRRET
jgi:tartrate dehydrogenase/decarboxylase/D-malate dehydrogenase